MAKIRNNGKLTDGQVGFLLVVPGIAVFIAVILYPFISAILMSFTDRTLLSLSSVLSEDGMDDHRIRHILDTDTIHAGHDLGNSAQSGIQGF